MHLSPTPPPAPVPAPLVASALAMQVTVVRLVHVRESGFTVARVRAERPTQEFTAVGVALAGVQPGESLELVGHWHRHPLHGQQLTVQRCTRTMPSSVDGARAYLASGLIHGIGPKLAAAIVETLGQDTFTVIDTDPDRLLEVSLIGPARQAQILTAYGAHRDIRDLVVELQRLGLPTHLAGKIYQRHGTASLDVLRHDPYQLIETVPGIAFGTADRIALSAGLPETSPARARAGLLDVLATAAARDGHTYLPADLLTEHAAELTHLPAWRLADARDSLVADGHLVVEALNDERPGQAVFPARHHAREQHLATAVARLLAAASNLTRTLAHHAQAPDITDPAHPGRCLSAEQQAAIRMALTRTVSVLTGGPGCGKSATVAALTALVKHAGGTITLAAPTGKATKRLTQLTGAPACTVHRLLARHDQQAGDMLFTDNPLNVDLIVIDEVSMLDLSLAAKLARKIPSGTHLLLVGDVDQLPSIGPGQVLRDLLAVPEIPRVHLTEVFRQAGGSAIITAAHLIRAGQPPRPAGEGLWFYPVAPDADSTQIAARVLELATERIPDTLGVPASSVQVLCPRRTGPTGTLTLGRALQERLNPASADRPEYWWQATPFRRGDRVTQVRNNYQRGLGGVFNGTTGIITDLDQPERRLIVTTDDGEPVTYDLDDLDELTHAYALSVHRAQGSEYDIVVAPLDSAAGHMLTRNLLYTLVTRARRWAVLVGHDAALQAAVRRATPARYSTLTRRLTDTLASTA